MKPFHQKQQTVITDTIWKEAGAARLLLWGLKDRIHKKTTVLERHAGTTRGAEEAEQILAGIRAHSSMWGQKENPEGPDMDGKRQTSDMLLVWLRPHLPDKDRQVWLLRRKKLTPDQNANRGNDNKSHSQVVSQVSPAANHSRVKGQGSAICRQKTVASFVFFLLPHKWFKGCKHLGGRWRHIQHPSCVAMLILFCHLNVTIHFL